MARLIYAERLRTDIDRVFDFLAETNLLAANKAVESIIDAVSILDAFC